MLDETRKLEVDTEKKLRFTNLAVPLETHARVTKLAESLSTPGITCSRWGAVEKALDAYEAQGVGK